MQFDPIDGFEVFVGQFSRGIFSQEFADDQRVFDNGKDDGGFDEQAGQVCGSDANQEAWGIGGWGGGEEQGISFNEEAVIVGAVRAGHERVGMDVVGGGIDGGERAGDGVGWGGGGQGG